MTFGQKLRELREIAGYTQQALADEVGVQWLTIQRYESQGRVPDVLLAKRLARALGVTLDELLCDVDGGGK